MGTKLVIFDLDNTLIITRPAAKKAYKMAINHIAKAHGQYHNRYKLYNHWKKIVQQLMGEKKPQIRRFHYSLAKLLQEQKLPNSNLAAAINTYEQELIDNLEPQKGARDLLDWLVDNGHTVAVATASDRSEATKKLKKTELFGFINLLVTPNETGVMKPDKSYYQIIIKEAGLSAKKAIVIGDSEQEDLEPAKALGIITLLVPHTNPHLGKLKPSIELFVSDKDDQL